MDLQRAQTTLSNEANRLSQQIKFQHEKAISLRSTNRQMALNALKRKKTLEKSLSQCEDNLTSLELMKEGKSPIRRVVSVPNGRTGYVREPRREVNQNQIPRNVSRGRLSRDQIKEKITSGDSSKNGRVSKKASILNYFLCGIYLRWKSSRR